MKTKDLIKKYWFVFTLAILAVVFVIFYAVEMNANSEKEIKTLKQDDSYVIYSIDGESYYADELYDELYSRYGFDSSYRALDRLVVESAVDTTSEMKTVASNNAQYLLSSYDRDTLDADLRSLGFNGIDDLANYYIYLQKNYALSKEYFLAHEEEYVTPYMEKSPRTISHILIKVADVEEIKNEDGTVTHKANPTEEETAKLNEVLEKLQSEDFAQVAYDYSEDSSNTNGGYLGLIDEDSKSKYVSEFADASMKLNEGEVSDVIVTQFGYHIIKCNASTVDTLLDNQDFISQLFDLHSNLYAQIILEKAQELNINIVDEGFKSELETRLNESEAE